MTNYQKTILEALRARYGGDLVSALDPNPETVSRWIEGHMRAEFGTLDGLSAESFNRAAIAGMREAARTSPDDNETIAKSFGL